MKQLKFLLILIFLSTGLFASNVNWQVIKTVNQKTLDITNKFGENKKWKNFFTSLSTYTYADYTVLIGALNIASKAEKVLLDKHVPVMPDYKHTNKAILKKLNALINDINKTLKTNPRDLKNAFRMMKDFKQLIELHNFTIQYYSGRTDDIILPKLYKTTYPNAQKYKFLKHETLGHLFGRIQKVYNQTYYKFIKDLKKNTYWFLRYFGKSVKYVKQINNENL